MDPRWTEGRAEAEAALGGDPLTCDAITADFRILQRRKGHRYSLDDLATAAEAVRAAGDAPISRYLDLGCGIGSALLMVSWRLRPATVVGIEALDVSATLARFNLRLNRLEARLFEGDHRDVTAAWTEPPFDLVTGTPPYLPVGTALASPDPQRAAARLELRGGIEDYLASADRVLAPGGHVVACAGGGDAARVLGEGGRVVACAGGGDAARVATGATAADLHPYRRLDVIARPYAKGPLFSVWSLRREAPKRFDHARLLVRGPDGKQTAEARAMRATFGLED